MPLRFATTLLLAAAVVHATIDLAGHLHVDDKHGKHLPSKWYHDDDHPLHGLFRRGTSNGSVAFAAIGTPEWSAGFPTNGASTTTMPKEWHDALKRAVDAGKIPNIPQTTSVANGSPTYPTGLDPNSTSVCSSTYKCVISGDIWDAPTGVLAISFDDGPLPASSTLYEFLRKNKEHATHFFIGQNILLNPQPFQTVINDNQDDLAVHTWTHPLMTTKTNEEVVAELGWTLQLIYNSTGGRIARFWRPPFGDSDMRVRAIAKEVFGLTTVIWNQDTGDWTLDQTPPGTTLEKISTQMQTWLTGSKTPGLVILEHELSDSAVTSFINAYPLMVSNGWKRVSLARMDGLGVYQNALDPTSPVTPAHIGDVGVKPPQANSTGLRKASSTSSVHRTTPNSKSSAARGATGSPHANQKSGAEHFNATSFVILSIVTFIAAVAGSVVL